MSNEEKLKRDRHQRIRKIFSIIFIVEIIMCIASLAFILYVNHESNELIYINYTETPSAEYEVSLINTSLWDEVTPGKAYEANNINTIDAKFSYETAVQSKSVKYSYQYNVSKYIIFSDRANGEFDPYLYEELKNKTGTVEGTKLSFSENISVSYEKANEKAIEFLERLNDGSVVAYLYIKMDVSVNASCDDFVTENTETATFLLKTQLAVNTTSVQNLSDSATGGKQVACTRSSMVALATKAAILPLCIALAVSILLFIIVLVATKNKDVDYANTIRRILSSYKSFIQVSTSKFTSNGFVVYKIGSITEMLEIRDTVQKPVIMIENEDKTCSKFFVIDGEVMYLHGICVKGYEHLLENEEENPINNEPVIVPEPIVEEEILEEVLEEFEEEILEEDEEEVLEEEQVSEIVEEEADETSRQFDLCSYTFEAKLILADDEMKNFYREIAEYALSYGVKVVRSAKRERIYLGRKLFANLTFSGKKLCVSLALNPADYVDSKYKFKDMSEVKKYAETPFVMKVTSGLKVRHIKELLTKMFEDEGLQNQNLDIKVKKIPTKSKKTLIKEGLIKVNTKVIK